MGSSDHGLSRFARNRAMHVRATRARAVGLFSLLTLAAVALPHAHGQRPEDELPPPRPLNEPPPLLVPPGKPPHLPALPAWLPRYDLDVRIDVAKHDV